MARKIVTTTVRIPPPYPRGRRCCEDGCGTVLCGYNPTDRCWPHGGWVEIVRTTSSESGELLSEVLDGSLA